MSDQVEVQEKSATDAQHDGNERPDTANGDSTRIDRRELLKQARKIVDYTERQQFLFEHHLAARMRFDAEQLALAVMALGLSPGTRLESVDSQALRIAAERHSAAQDARRDANQIQDALDAAEAKRRQKEAKEAKDGQV